MRKHLLQTLVSLRNFEIIPKHKYDNGDYEKTIILNNFNIV